MKNSREKIRWVFGIILLSVGVLLHAGAVSQSFEYDQAGCLIEQRCGDQVLVRYEYGYLDKVISVTRGHEATRFHYNARGMLVGKERNGQMIDTLGWDGIGLLAKGDTVYANEAHVSGGVPLLSVNEKQTDFYDHDYLGTTTAHYSAEGETRSALHGSLGQGADNSESRFTGKPYDEELAAHVFPYRNYRSDMGRWSSADPAGFPDGPNRHYYAPVPTTGLDPMGLVEIKLISQNIPADAVGNQGGEKWILYGMRQDGAFVGEVSDSFDINTNIQGVVYEPTLMNPHAKKWDTTAYLNFKIGWDAKNETLTFDDLDETFTDSDGAVRLGLRVEYEIRDNGKEIKVEVYASMTNTGTGLTGVGVGISGGQIGGDLSLNWTNHQGIWQNKGVLIFKEL